MNSALQSSRSYGFDRVYVCVSGRSSSFLVTPLTARRAECWLQSTWLSNYGQYNVHLSVRLSICLSVHLSVCLSVCSFVCLSVHLSVRSSVCLSFCLFFRLSLCPSVSLSVCLSICLSVAEAGWQCIWVLMSWLHSVVKTSRQAELYIARCLSVHLRPVDSAAAENPEFK